jgi:hypothetical protein
LLVQRFGGTAFQDLFKDEKGASILLDCIASWQFTLVSDMVQKNIISNPNLNTFWGGRGHTLKYSTSDVN